MAMRKLKKKEKLNDQEESEEINACSIVVPIRVDGVEEEWLINFKNETHNHPTEIEPFWRRGNLPWRSDTRSAFRTYLRISGDACDRSGRSYSIGKGYAERKITAEKIGERSCPWIQFIWEPNRTRNRGGQRNLSPRLCGKAYGDRGCSGAAPRRAVIRETSDPGDIIILLGGRTGRDGCGGATGSSKVHTEESIETCGAEVQKGNPPTERKIQRLFRREEVSCLIKKCNDFGAGGVSVAIGELADGLRVDLDKVPKKYAGLDGTEIAISNPRREWLS